MTAGPDTGHAAYVPLQASRSEIAGQPTIVALPVPKPYGDYGKIVEWRINESFPDAVGAFVAWLVNESGWTVEEQDRTAAILPRHIAILLRRFRTFRTDVTRAYVRALEARRIPQEARRRSGPAPCCPRFGDDSVVERGPEGRPPANGSVRPGLHCPKADGPGVVWWDPAVLSLEVEGRVRFGDLCHLRISYANRPRGNRDVGFSDSKEHGWIS